MAVGSVMVCVWLRGLDLNQRPSGYEPDELPGCSTPRKVCGSGRVGVSVGAGSDRSRECGGHRGGRCGVTRRALGRPGGDRLSRVLRHSTMGAGAFDGRVRDGIGSWAHRSGHQAGAAHGSRHGGFGKRWSSSCVVSGCPSAFAAAGQFRTRIMRAIKPIGRLVPVSSVHYCTCTPGLSTWSSSTALKGALVLRWVSRLDAFSGYPVRT